MPGKLSSNVLRRGRMARQIGEEDSFIIVSGM
jgi:hypothetical protein